jgi:hypothetical protein
MSLVESAEMLVNLGIPWVILGHSERRSLLNESNEVNYMILMCISYTLNICCLACTTIPSIKLFLYWCFNCIYLYF